MIYEWFSAQISVALNFERKSMLSKCHLASFRPYPGSSFRSPHHFRDLIDVTSDVTSHYGISLLGLGFVHDKTSIWLGVLL